MRTLALMLVASFVAIAGLVISAGAATGGPSAQTSVVPAEGGDSNRSITDANSANSDRRVDGPDRRKQIEQGNRARKRTGPEGASRGSNAEISRQRATNPSAVANRGGTGPGDAGGVPANSNPSFAVRHPDVAARPYSNVANAAHSGQNPAAINGSSKTSVARTASLNGSHMNAKAGVK